MSRHPPFTRERKCLVQAAMTTPDNYCKRQVENHGPRQYISGFQMGIFHGADLYDGALLAAIAVIGIIGRYPLAHNAEIIQTWLNTVVWAAADADFELVGKFDIIPALVECFVQFTR